MLAIVLCGGLAIAVSGEQPTSIHLEESAAYRGAPAVLTQPATARKQGGGTRSFNRVVYGYFPYWISSTDLIPWSYLTHLSYFSVEVRSNGTLGNSHGWSTNGWSLVETGHAHGVKVTLTATLFDNDAIGTLLGNTTARNDLIDNLVALVQAQGGDGINIDFESVPRTAKPQFVSFMAALTSAFRLAIPGAHVSLASPAVDWAGSYDYDELALACDGLMIMGYGYHWSGGNPGPNAPIYSGSTWSGLDLVWTIEDYLEWGGVENRRQFVLGLPLYGIDWPATSAAVPGTAAGTGVSRTVSVCESMLVGGAWDEDSATPFKVYQNNGWRQLFCEDEQSLALKMDLVEQYDLGGVMFWAIGYTAVDHPMWAAVEERFIEEAPIEPSNQPPVAIAQAPNDARVGATIVLDGSGSSDPDGDPLTFRWAQVNGPALSITEADRPRAMVVPAAPGQYSFSLTVSDGQATSDALAVVVVLEPAASPSSRLEGGCRAVPGALAPLLAFALLVRRRRLA